jgi:hypothetical protein
MSVIFLLYTDACNSDKFDDEWASYIPYLDKANLTAATGHARSASIVDIKAAFPDYVGIATNIETLSEPSDEVYLVFELQGMPVARMLEITGQTEKYPQLNIFNASMKAHSHDSLFGGIDRVYCNSEHNVLVAVTKTGAAYYRNQLAQCLRKRLKIV